MRFKAIVAIGLFLYSTFCLAAIVDCSEAYKGLAAKCEQIKCDEKFKSFLGTWTGPMEQIVDMESDPAIYRKYQNTITYAETDCLRNTENGDSLIIGRQTDVFPATQNLKAKVEEGLLITGRDVKGNPFLRTVDLSKKPIKTVPYELVHKNDVAVLSIWKSTGVENGYPYTVETIDAQDWTVENPEIQHRRNVTVTLQSGDYKRILVRGFHTKQ